MSKIPRVLGEVGHNTIGDLVDTQSLETHIANRVVSRRGHPTLPLAILNYTDKATFDNIWDAVTIRCRGLIYDQTNEQIVAVPFQKFFNYETLYRPETLAVNLPTHTPEITEKLDGSLGILYRYKGFTGISTRGSFNSDQAVWATAWLNRNLPDAEWPENCTPLFEIIYPENRVVVKYDHEGLTLIGCVDNDSGIEYTHDQLEALGHRVGCRVVNLVTKPLDDCRAENRDNEEGYVATWHFDEQPSLKIKIKFATYFRLHRLLTSTSPKRIWEYLRDAIPLDELIQDTPEHYREWAFAWKAELEAEYGRIEMKARSLFAQCPIPEGSERKTFALWFTNGDVKRYSSILFKLLDKQPYAEIIWKQVKEKTRDQLAFRGMDE
jgi:RNA ligase